MTDGNQEILTDKDHELFLDIAKDIRTNPTRYHEAGNWLKEYCSEDAYWQRQENKLKELQSQNKRFPTLPIVHNLKQLEQEMETKRTPALLIRFQEARDSLLGKYEDQQFIPEEDARRIVIITWLLTDPDTEKANLNITQLEKWSWGPIDDVIKMSRGYAAYLWSHGGRVYSPWMNLVRICWAKLTTQQKNAAELSSVHDGKRILFKSFVTNLLRASIKHLPICGAFLHDVIYGTLDSQESRKETMGQRKPSQSDVVFEKRNSVARCKLTNEKSSESISLKVAKITLIAAIITLVGAILTSPLWEPFINNKRGDSDEIEGSSADNKLLLSLKEICRDIDSRPVLQKEQTAKNYVGMRIRREPLNLNHIIVEGETFEILMVFPGEPYRPFIAGWGVSFSVMKNDYPQLATAKQGLQLYVSGKIEDAGQQYIHLSDVSLSFD